MYLEKQSIVYDFFLNTGATYESVYVPTEPDAMSIALCVVDRFDCV